MKKKRVNFAEIREDLKLIDLSKALSVYSIECFKAEKDEYTKYLSESAMLYQNQSISHTHLLVRKTNRDVVAYLTLITDSVTLMPVEKESDKLDVPFSTIPALKIAKLAIDINYNERYFGIGTFLIEIARGFAYQINQNGVACRYLTVDADTLNNPTVVDFYKKNQFILNEKFRSKSRNNVSMRSDLFFE